MKITTKNYLSRLLVVMTLGQTAASNATTYTWFELPILSGYESSIAYQINDVGQVVGVSGSPILPNNDVQLVATIWQNGLVESLTSLGSSKSVAYSINNAGQIVGASIQQQTLGWQATLWADNSVSNLGVIDGYDSSIATSINNFGQIVGQSYRNTNIPDLFDIRATLWSSGQVYDLGTLGGTESRASAINDKGLIVGDSNITGFGVVNGPYEATVWNASTLEPPKSIGLDATALGVNNYNQIVGITGYPQPPTSPTLWENGSSENLGSFSATGEGFAVAINDSGEVVGSSSNGIATYWSKETGLLNINLLLATPLPSGIILNSANDINNVGQILVTSANGLHYILTPLSVPVPSSLWLFIFAITGLLFLQKKAFI